MGQIKYKGINYTGGGSGSGGHTIIDRDDTSLEQESSLKFAGGLKASDDSTNSQTIVTDDADVYTWTQWNALTPQQQAAIPKALITGAPGADGDVSADLLTKLWENPSPTSAFAAGSITLASSDYDFLLWIYKNINVGVVYYSTIIEKGSNATLQQISYYTSAVHALQRVCTYSTDTSFSIGDNTDNSATQNQYNIPIVVYGIKKTINLQFSAIASDVSTAADHCMLTDGTTSVEDALAQNISKSQTAGLVKNDGTIDTSDYTIGTNVKYINVVTTLPPDAASHTDTLYLIKET